MKTEHCNNKITAFTIEIQKNWKNIQIVFLKNRLFNVYFHIMFKFLAGYKTNHVKMSEIQIHSYWFSFDSQPFCAKGYKSTKSHTFLLILNVHNNFKFILYYNLYLI